MAWSRAQPLGGQLCPRLQLTDPTGEFAEQREPNFGLTPQQPLEGRAREP